MAFTSNRKNVGEFQHKDTGCYFTYKLTEDPWALSQGWTHEVDVLDGYRFAIVKKTVVKVLVDEEVVESWLLKKHTVYLVN